MKIFTKFREQEILECRFFAFAFTFEFDNNIIKNDIVGFVDGFLRLNVIINFFEVNAQGFEFFPFGFRGFIG